MAGLKIVPFKFPDISYSVYVYHYPVVLYLSAIVGIATLPRLIAMSLVTVVPLCIVSWYLVEKPAIRFKRKPLRPSIKAIFVRRERT
jgi:peptidoglycan/LPS O-acetylase OafA/YrhL